MSQRVDGVEPVGADLTVVDTGERGMTTAEYAIGVVMVIALVIVVIKAIQGGWLAPLVMTLVQAIFKLITLQMGL